MKTKHLLAIILLLLTGRVAFAAVPVITSYTPSSGTVGSLVIVRGSNLGNQTSFTIGGKAAIVVSNNGTKIVGMVMPGAVTGPVTVTTASGSVNGAVVFTVKDNIAPNTPQGARLSAGGLIGTAHQGASVGISADGLTAVVGGPWDNSYTGAAWVYKLRGSTWILQTGKLLGTDIGSVSPQIGTSVAISADGNTVLIGAPYEIDGAVRVFIRKSDSTWVQQGAKLTSKGVAGSSILFGQSVALSADGNTAVIGAPGDNKQIGATWIFVRTGNTWTQQGDKLTRSEYLNYPQQGFRVTVSADGNTLAACAAINTSSYPQGSVSLYTRSGTAWSQLGNIITDTSTPAKFGCSASLSADGNTLIVGLNSDDVSGTPGAWVYNRSGNNFIKQPNQIALPNYVAYLSIVSLSADGKTAAIGQQYGPKGVGATWVFKYLSGVWVQQGDKLIGTDPNTGGQGSAVALNTSGSALLVGGPAFKNSVGASWAFVGTTATQSQSITFAQPSAMIYGAPDFSPASASSGLPITYTSSNVNVATVVAGKIHISGVGSVIITAKQPGNATYQPATTISRTITVTKASLNIAADSKIITFGDALPALTATYTGFVNGEGPSVFTTAVAIQTTATSSSPPGTYPITVSSAVAANYTITYKAGTLTIKPSTTIASYSPMFGPVGSLVTITGNNLDNPSVVTIGGQPAIVVSNTGTKLVGMVMPGTASGTIGITTAGGSATSTGSFTVTNTSTPNTQQGSLLSVNNLSGNPGQGLSVALSANGTTAIVGGFSDNSNLGAAWVYKLTGSNWVLQSSKLVGTDAVGATVNQGKAVSISADGNTAIVGGYNDNTGVGAAWIYIRQADSTWVQQGTKLTASDAVGAAGFGYSVAMSADGNTVAIGGYHDDSSKGAAWVFTRTGTTWAQQGVKLFATGATGNGAQGSAVAISADGTTLMASAFNDNGGIGAAWIFTRTGTTWAQQSGTLVGTAYTGSPHMGFGVALSADGNTAALGGPADDTNAGATWVFTRSGTTWTQYGSKIASPTGAVGSPGFGKAIGLSADGKTIAIGAYQDNTNAGAIWLYRLKGSTYTQQGNKLFGSGATGAAQQGIAVALSANGLTVLSGGSANNGGKGAVWAFYVVPPAITAFAPTSGPVGTLVTVTGTNLANQTGFVIGGKPAVVVSSTGTKLIGMVMPEAVTGSLNVITGGGTATTAGTFEVTTVNLPNNQVGSKLTNAGITGQALFGIANALSADGKTAIVGSPGDDGNKGAAWVYKLSGDAWVLQSGKLIGTGATGSATQGRCVALSADGNTAVIGGDGDNSGKGAIWIFVRQADSTWLQQGAKLVGSGIVGSSANFGNAVAISADGNTVIAGAANDNTNIGAAWFFVRNGTTWSQQGNKMIGTGIDQFAYLGTAVALSADGNTALVGGPLDSGGSGAIWYYARNGNTWTQQGNKITSTNRYSSNMANALTISADGKTFIAGAPAFDNKGAFWVFVKSGNTFTQSGNIITVSSDFGSLGYAVSLSADGKTAAIAVTSDNHNGGGVLFYKPVNGTWTQQGNKLIGTGATGPASQGYGLAMSADGTTLLFGGPGDDSYKGAVWTFSSTLAQPQTIAFSRPQSINTTSAMFNAAATASSGLPVTYVSSNPYVAKIVDGKIQPISRGTVTITALQAGNREFKPAEPVARTLTISRDIIPNSASLVDGPIVDPALSPNGDGKNDVLTIKNIEMYPDNKLSIINTNGDGIFEATGYNNQSKVFDGTSTIDGKKQKPGTYYYRLEYKDNGVLKSKTGYIVIKY